MGREHLRIELPHHVVEALALLPKDQSGLSSERATRALVTLARHAARGFANADSWERVMLELAFQFGSNIHAARSLSIILDVLRRIDRRHAKRLVEAIAAFIPYATRTPKVAKRPKP